jgi:hypothetical protein
MDRKELIEACEKSLEQVAESYGKHKGIIFKMVTDDSYSDFTKYNDQALARFLNYLTGMALGDQVLRGLY